MSKGWVSSAFTPAGHPALSGATLFQVRYRVLQLVMGQDSPPSLKSPGSGLPPVSGVDGGASWRERVPLWPILPHVRCIVATSLPCSQHLGWVTQTFTNRVGSIVLPGEVQDLLSQVLQMVGTRDRSPTLVASKPVFPPV